MKNDGRCRTNGCKMSKKVIKKQEKKSYPKSSRKNKRQNRRKMDEVSEKQVKPGQKN